MPSPDPPFLKLSSSDASFLADVLRVLYAETYDLRPEDFPSMDEYATRGMIGISTDRLFENVRELRGELAQDINPTLKRVFDYGNQAKLWDAKAKDGVVYLTLTPNGASYIERLPNVDVFLSYASADGPLAKDLKARLEEKGLRCFLAEKDIPIRSEFEKAIREALETARQVLILVTPRSITRPWILLEVGAAWVLQKPLIPAIAFVEPQEMVEPLRKFQAARVETPDQIQDLVNRIVNDEG